jgi:hypothetical protein
VSYHQFQQLDVLLIEAGSLVDQRDLREVEKRLDRLDAERTHLVDQLTPVELPTVM